MGFGGRWLAASRVVLDRIESSHLRLLAFEMMARKTHYDYAVTGDESPGESLRSFPPCRGNRLPATRVVDSPDFLKQRLPKQVPRRTGPSNRVQSVSSNVDCVSPGITPVDGGRYDA